MSRIKSLAKKVVPQRVRNAVKYVLSENYRDRLYWEHDRQVGQRVFGLTGGEVVAGPFKGLKYVSMARGSSIGPKLRDLRLQRGLSLQQLAERANVSAAAIHKIEKSGMVPTITTLLKLAGALNRSISYFVDEETEQNGPAVLVRADERRIVYTSHLGIDLKDYDSRIRTFIPHYEEMLDVGGAAIPSRARTIVDLGMGTEKLLSDGPACDAILASCAIPGILPPVTLGDQLLVDGGVVNNTPISHAVALGAERIYVLPTQDRAHFLTSAPRTALDAAIYGIGLLVGSRLDSDIARYGRDVEVIVLPAPNAARVQPTDFDHSSRLMAAAYAAAREALVEAVPVTLQSVAA